MAAGSPQVQQCTVWEHPARPVPSGHISRRPGGDISVHVAAAPWRAQDAAPPSDASQSPWSVSTSISVNLPVEGVVEERRVALTRAAEGGMPRLRSCTPQWYHPLRKYCLTSAAAPATAGAEKLVPTALFTLCSCEGPASQCPAEGTSNSSLPVGGMLWLSAVTVSPMARISGLMRPSGVGPLEEYSASEVPSGLFSPAAVCAAARSNMAVLAAQQEAWIFSETAIARTETCMARVRQQAAWLSSRKSWQA
mmetsp:Transcript_64078/g.202731  ORF Transcript_64078/g.202731 Transcript_64078/m.202731 type:complete len:251 (+) Transcript_64078:137-889(+)